MNESEITKRAVQKMRAKGWFVSKIHGGPQQASGLPDVVGCAEGLFFGLEFKRPDKRNNVTPRQRKALGKIREAGGLAEVVCSPKEAIDTVEEALSERST